MDSKSAEHRSRHAAHVIQTTHRAVRWVKDLAGIEDTTAALTALEVVAGAIVRRVTPAEARDFIAQLPSELREPLLGLPAGPDKGLTLESVRAELAARLSIDEDQAAKLLPNVGLALRQLITPGEARDVWSQLPLELRQLLPDQVAHATP